MGTRWATPPSAPAQTPSARPCARQTCSAAWAGEEFAALLPHANADSARQVAERIRGAIAQLGLVSPSGHPVTFTISIGMAASERHHTGIEPLLADADAALYRAKATGRNRVLAHEAALPAH